MMNSEGGKEQYRLVALLAEGSISEKNEAPKVIIKLGSIQEKFLNIKIGKTRAFHQGLFWAKVDQMLENLGLDKEMYGSIEDQISNKIPRPPDDWALWGVTCIPHIDC